MSVPSLTLSTQTTIPGVGFGLWKMTDEAACKQAIRWALDAGYRHFDTAQVYGNEQWLGDVLQQAIASGEVRRDELFITTKIAVQHFGRKHARTSFDTSFNKLGLEYIDLVLLHFPVPLLRKASWQTLQDIHEEGRARAIGVSNFTVRHLNDLLENATVVPAVNQVELHVYLQQPELLEFCRAHDIVVEAYSPLAHGYGLDSVELARVAQKHHKSSGQIMLRWCVEQGAVPLPKSVHENRIIENLDIFDFKLDSDDHKVLAELNQNKRTCWDPTLVP